LHAAFPAFFGGFFVTEVVNGGQILGQVITDPIGKPSSLSQLAYYQTLYSPLSKFE
jgi:hypothetical protein